MAAVQSLPLLDESAMTSPDFVRISLASAMALKFRPGRFAREFDFGGINLLLNYADGCKSDCGYCGLARSRPGSYDEKSFIRVEWPLVPTDRLIDRMAARGDQMTRVCISMVTHKRSFPDTLDISRRITTRTDVPLSILVAPPTLNRERLEAFKDAGVDMIGIGLDAVTEELFRSRRKDVPQGGGLKWSQYWQIVQAARDIFGPWKVNCHTLVGLGETDLEAVDVFYELKPRQVFAYLFCFNPEPDSRMAGWPKSPLSRWRRIQLVKWLIEERDLPRKALEFDDEGNMVRLRAAPGLVSPAIESGLPFMTNGCPSKTGELGCSRPYGSYRPSEPYRDFPFKPEPDDVRHIYQELDLPGFLVDDAAARPGGGREPLIGQGGTSGHAD
ncbi:MAG: radical SAM protein [Chloroflexota bacterium]